jgi:glycolate oxidase iron-sulfur subunit
MQTSLPEAFIATDAGKRAEAVLRSCVHCGFCNATCPTYQLLGDELDGPRGRIYLIKDMLEQQEASAIAGQHLDRCLTCRACETTCPSGVGYGELLEIGRNYLEANRSRPLAERFVRRWLLRVVPNPKSFAFWTSLGRLARPFLSARLKRQLPGKAKRTGAAVPEVTDPVGTVLLLDGCVQRTATPGVNDALERLLAARQIKVRRVQDEGCCGGLALHLGEEATGLRTMAANLDALAPALDEVDAVISTASGCGVTLKDYGRLLAGDDARREQAALLSDKVMDAGEYLAGLGGEWGRADDVRKVALHVPCTLQHGQRRGSAPGEILSRAGYELVATRDDHLCCGSAGSYALLQGEISEQLGANKVAALTGADPDVIATANVGCQMHLGGQTRVPVRHWLELLAPPGEAE